LRKKREKQNGEKAKEEEKKFIHDGRFKHALIQLALKVRRPNPYSDRKKIINEAILIAEEIWLMLEEERKQCEGGRVGETLDRVTGPSRKERAHMVSSPPQGKGPA
jgi:hypothetical protein